MKTIKKMMVCALAVAGAVALPALAVESVQVLFPYVIVGRAVDYENKAFDASSGVTMKVSSEDGTVLAQTKVRDLDRASAWNFRLGVPVASAHVPGYAAKGDTLVLTVMKDGTLYKGFLKGDDARIGEAGAAVVIRVMLSEDANGNGIADSYEQSKYNWMRRYKISGDFDPNADYDGDGQSNYAEYLAGTDPFDAKDVFQVNSETTEAGDGQYMKVTFEANAGRTYSVQGTDDLGAPSGWKKEKFKTDPNAAATQERVVSSRNDWEEKTVYLLKQGTRRFYKVELEQ